MFMTLKSKARNLMTFFGSRYCFTVYNIPCLWRSPRETFPIYKLNLVFDHEQEGADLFPFTLKTDVPNEYQLIATVPVSYKIYLIKLSPSYKDAVVLRIII